MDSRSLKKSNHDFLHPSFITLDNMQTQNKHDKTWRKTDMQKHKCTIKQ